jgi:hypothetical protein
MARCRRWKSKGKVFTAFFDCHWQVEIIAAVFLIRPSQPGWQRRTQPGPGPRGPAPFPPQHPTGRPCGVRRNSINLVV